MRVKYFFYYGYDGLQLKCAIAAYSDSTRNKSFLRNPLYKWEVQLKELTPLTLNRAVVREKIRATLIINEMRPNFYLYDWLTKEVIARPIKKKGSDLGPTLP